MAGKISELDAAAALTGAELVELVQSAANVQSDVDALKTYINPLTTKGDISVYGTGNTRLPVGANGQLLSADSAEATGLKWVNASSGSSPLTTKGDIWVYGSADDRLPVGTNGQILSANSAEATGLDWIDPVNLGDIQDTWSDSGTTYVTLKITVTKTSYGANSRMIQVMDGATERFYVGPLQSLLHSANGVVGTTGKIVFNQGGWVTVSSDGRIGLSSSSTGLGSSNNQADTAWARSAAGILLATASDNSTGGAIEFIERTAPSAPSANRVRLYSQDNGSGKTQLMALFATGAAQQVAIEP